MGEVANVHVLHFMSGRQRGREFPIAPEQSCLAGRSSEVDIVLKDDTVSRKHARFFHARGRVWMRDLGSRNGTIVNGQRVDRHCLREGDRISIGATLLRVDLVPASQLSRRTQPEDASGRSMSGTLADIPLSDVLQWLATSRKTGSLVVKGEHEGRLFLRQGQVYYAKIEGSEVGPQKALLRMLSWADGTFGLDSSAEEQFEDELATSLDHLLMEAARQQDELAHLAERKAVPSERIELVFPPGKPWRELDPHGLDLVQALASGPTTWPALLDALPLDDVSLTKAAVELKRAGVVDY